MSAKKIVLTGGPCGGKTTILNNIQQEFAGSVIQVCEVASLLLPGFPPPHECSDELQAAILNVQRNMEQAWLRKADAQGVKAIVFDRGLLEGAAYITGGLPAFVEQFGVDPATVFAQYDVVIHLESVACYSSALYEQLKASNPARYENAEQARERDQALKDVWSTHPGWIHLEARLGLPEITRRILEILSEIIDTEIERKFRLPHLPEILSSFPPARIRQGYLITEPGELRIRQLDNHHTITGKSDGDDERQEWERPLPQRIFENFWPATNGKRIFKNRHCVPHQEFTLEVDVYTSHLQGLLIMEVEVPSHAHLAGFTIPTWAAGAVDVTDDPRYKNKRLALHGLPSH